MKESMDERYMRRAIQLAACGGVDVSPNPHVGAVVVADGRIIGEGYHRRIGEGHAEVNAIASVKESDRHLLGESTVYVTLEPCSHYGKTPPCAKLLIDSGVKRVVVGVQDSFPEVSGRGIAMLRDAGIEVVTGVLEAECEALNRKFMTAHRFGRPYITLKWAKSADNFIAATDDAGAPQCTRISNSLSSMLAHRERAMNDAIMVGTRTVAVDNPRLDTRLWPGRNPLKVTFNRSGNLPSGSHVANSSDAVIFDGDESLDAVVAALYREHKVSSLLVEGGRRLLESFLAAGLYDELRVETSTDNIGRGVPAPRIPDSVKLVESTVVRGNRIERFRR